MGVPALFRKYPRIVEQVVEDESIRIQVEGGKQPGHGEITSDMSQKNPKRTKDSSDNLYLDMNGIVHSCTHPKGKKPPKTEQEMMVEVFSYTNQVASMVRPRKLLIIAISTSIRSLPSDPTVLSSHCVFSNCPDGVDTRAKINQQHSHWFRVA
ncbi:XRN 5'-3' exonuclease N-terminus-domain-containing protein [Phakopsora pachyrhizi]|uniref:XRN 5'-3' exonuclease N-terminus-domain-containing protein n=1 Tax=Phakopsora pachyrhizi TaxID=170000 RepID=A0AAV0B5V6_PHAPC|nr:XRN 5'-3' exonuclease N-terminus-domain-containing protein [Phakopsora pachyrhizi]